LRYPGAQGRECRRKRVNRVLPSPRPRRVRADAMPTQLHAQRPVATAFDDTVRRLAEHCEVGREELGTIACEATEPVAPRLDLLLVVEDPGDIGARLCKRGRECELDRDTALHVDAAAADERVDA